MTSDLFADLDLAEIAHTTRVIDYPRGLEAVLRQDHGGGWMYCGALENDPDLIERWSHLRPLYGNSARTLHDVRDPWRLAECLHRAGLPCPALSKVEPGLPRDGTWLQKPLKSAGGSGVAALSHTMGCPERPVYYQQLVEGAAVSAAFVAAGGAAVLLGATRQRLLPGTFRYCGSIGPLQLPFGVRGQFEAIGAALAETFGLVGLFGVDAVLADGVVWPVEVNPRYTASVEVLERALGFSAVGWHVAACREERLPTGLAWKNTEVVGKQIVFAEKPFVIPTDLRQRLPDLADVPRPGEAISTGSPILTVIRSDQCETEVLQSLATAVAAVRAALD